MRAKKSLGQNFLKSTAIARDIASAAQIAKGETVVEIGPGKGVLTRALLDQGARVVAVEKDQRMTEILEETFTEEIRSGTLTLVHGDILEFDTLSHGLKAGQYKLVANIPYYITGLILRQALSGNTQPTTMVLLAQKEVADRIIARDKKESLLSLSVKAYGTPRYVKKVPARYFSPAPKVDSAVIAIEHISRAFFKDIHEEAFFAVLKKAFASKRKQVQGTLKKEHPQIADVLRVCDVSEKARPEDISLEKWRCLLEHLN